MKAADRRVLILEAAIEEYGRTGMHEVSTEVIAERAGVSQPYIFRLFGTKKGLIIAAITHTDQLRADFRQAVADRGEASPMDAMAASYIQRLNDDPNSLRCQLHTWAAASDPEIGPVARKTYLAIIEDVRELSGEDHATVLDFMATGMLLTVAAALELPEIYNDPALLPQDS